jgi:type 1 glutamine amidotransferase
MSEVGFMTTFARGCEWAATGEVTLPATFSIFARKSDVPRVLVVTGGHDYDAEFYSLFDGRWLTWAHATSNEEAFKNDLRDKYDVLLLYDLSRELSDKGKSNLRNFVESGKGILAVHHAIADYNSWDWWWKDVIGGRYILEGGSEPSSTYQHDVEMFIRPVDQHPITRGLGAMHFFDETYKKMWISQEVKIILETDEPTSDGPLAWISPYERSRVVYIQLGHDRHAFLHPGYRQLIRQAVEWSAGK